MKKFLSVILIMVIMLDFSGCHALRKKFVRKRRKEIAPPLYLELKEYPKVPTKDMYDEYYLFVRAWLDELTQAVEENVSAKRQKKSIDEALKNLEQIIYFLNEEGKKEIEPLHTQLVSLREKIYDPYFLTSGNTTYVTNKIYRIKRDFEKKFTYEKATVWMQE